MDKLNIPLPSNDVPFNWDDLDFFLGQATYNKGIYNALNFMLSALGGNNFIVQGCEQSGSDIVTEGWVMLGGELIAVDQHQATGNFFEKTQTNNPDGNKETRLGGTVDIYQKNRATATASSGSLRSPFNISGRNPLRFKDVVRDIANSDTYVAISGEIYEVTDNVSRVVIPDVESSVEVNVNNYTRDVVSVVSEGGVGAFDDTNFTIKANKEYLFRRVSGNWIKISERLGVEATQSEAIDGVDDSKVMTPERVEEHYQALAANEGETKAGAISDKHVTPAGLKFITDGLLTEIKSIGVWNMDTTPTLAITHGLTFSKIIHVRAFIVDDTNSLKLDLVSPLSNSLSQGAINTGNTEITLIRATGGAFDSSSYSSGLINRGWVIISYLF